MVALLLERFMSEVAGVFINFLAYSDERASDHLYEEPSYGVYKLEDF
jgi:hypothetical protein